MIKKIFKYICKKILKIIPLNIIIFFFEKIIYLKLDEISSKKALKTLLKLDNFIYQLSGSHAINFGNGRHVKQRLIGYVNFFSNEAVKFGGPFLDVGCGNGELSHEISQLTTSHVVGIDLCESKIKKARKNFNRKNLKFINGNIVSIDLRKEFKTLILSNILEHIEFRIKFLENLLKNYKPEILLIRVPLYERDWRVPLKKELGIEWRLDKTHFIEYRVSELFEELNSVGIKIKSHKICWGEIWLTAGIIK